jgi:hypothetical protein
MATRRWIALAVAATAALAIGACGGDEESEPAGPDPATIVPSQALVYAEATVRPDDDQRDDLEAALATVLGVNDVGAAIREQLDSLLSDSDLTYQEDVEPWLGDRVGVFLLSFDQGPDGAFVVPTTDKEAAQTALNKMAESEGVRGRRTEDGIPYVLTENDSALGIVGDFAVVGSSIGFDEVAEASRGESLAESDEFAEMTGDLRGDHLVTAYADPDGILSALSSAGELSTRQLSELGDSLAGVLGEPIALSAGADENGFFAELAATGEAPVGGGTDLIERIPDDAWVAFGLSDAGALAAPALTAALASDEALARVLDRLQGEGGTGLDDLAASIGDAAGWFGGSNVLTSNGGLIFETDDEAAARGVLDRLRAALSAEPGVAIRPGDFEGEAFSAGPADVPIEFPLVLRDGLLVTGLGEQSVEQVYEPESSLTDSEAYEAGQEALGDDFSTSLLIDFQALVGFFEGLNVADEPDLQEALPYMARLDVFAAGSADDDESTRLRFILRPREE